jgi:tetratricopeptide (TPR) repeat protein
MKPLGTSLIALSAAVVASTVAATWIVDRDHSGALAPGAWPSGERSSPSSLAELAQRQVALEAEIAELRLAIQNGGSGGRAEVFDFDAAFERWASAREQREHSKSATDARALDPAAEKMRELLAKLLDPALDAAARSAMLNDLRKSGDLDSLIHDLETRVQLDPDDPAANLLLGQAYIERIQQGDLGAQAGDLALRADRAFDAALAADPRNWDARYQKAVALSYWPPDAGKSAEAIRQFETLLAQPGQDSARPESAQAYRTLGNLYWQSGDHQHAVAIWSHGLALFPDDQGLQQQLATAQQH